MTLTNNKESSEKEFEILFWKVIHNKYLFYKILDEIQLSSFKCSDIESYKRGYKIQFKNITTLKFLIDRGLWALLKDKLVHSKETITDLFNYSSIQFLFRKCSEKTLSEYNLIPILYDIIKIEESKMLNQQQQPPTTAELYGDKRKLDLIHFAAINQKSKSLKFLVENEKKESSSSSSSSSNYNNRIIKFETIIESIENCIGYETGSILFESMDVNCILKYRFDHLPRPAEQISVFKQLIQDILKYNGGSCKDGDSFNLQRIIYCIILNFKAYKLVHQRKKDELPEHVENSINEIQYNQDINTIEKEKQLIKLLLCVGKQIDSSLYQYYLNKYNEILPQVKHYTLVLEHSLKNLCIKGLQFLIKTNESIFQSQFIKINFKADLIIPFFTLFFSQSKIGFSFENSISVIEYIVSTQETEYLNKFKSIPNIRNSFLKIPNLKKFKNYSTFKWYIDTYKSEIESSKNQEKGIGCFKNSLPWLQIDSIEKVDLIFENIKLFQMDLYEGPLNIEDLNICNYFMKKFIISDQSISKPLLFHPTSQIFLVAYQKAIFTCDIDTLDKIDSLNFTFNSFSYTSYSYHKFDSSTVEQGTSKGSPIYKLFNYLNNSNFKSFTNKIWKIVIDSFFNQFKPWLNMGVDGEDSIINFNLNTNFTIGLIEYYTFSNYLPNGITNRMDVIKYIIDSKYNGIQFNFGNNINYKFLNGAHLQIIEYLNSKTLKSKNVKFFNFNSVNSLIQYYLLKSNQLKCCQYFKLVEILFRVLLICNDCNDINQVYEIYKQIEQSSFYKEIEFNSTFHLFYYILLKSSKLMSYIKCKSLVYTNLNCVTIKADCQSNEMGTISKYINIGNGFKFHMIYNKSVYEILSMLVNQLTINYNANQLYHDNTSKYYHKCIKQDLMYFLRFKMVGQIKNFKHLFNTREPPLSNYRNLNESLLANIGFNTFDDLLNSFLKEEK